MTEKALVIKGKFDDLGDLLAVARAEGKKIFKTKDDVNVTRVFYDPEFYVVVVKLGCNQPSGCKERSIDE